MKRQHGFTLIELVMVIVILGILAATAIPRFVNLTGEARSARVQGFAGALGSGAAINYASRSANAALGAAVANCTDVEGTLQTPLPADMSITAAAIAVDAAVNCTVSDSEAPPNTATFTGLGIL